MPLPAIRPGSLRHLWPWLLWLAAFYAVWLGLLTVPGNAALVRAHWPIAVAMLFGSYVAGSTPMGAMNSRPRWVATLVLRSSQWA